MKPKAKTGAEARTPCPGHRTRERRLSEGEIELRNYSSRLISRRSLPLFFETTVATVVNPFFR